MQLLIWHVPIVTESTGAYIGEPGVCSEGKCNSRRLTVSDDAYGLGKVSTQDFFFFKDLLKSI